MATYVELQLTSHFSFLRGASSPEELFAAAALLGHTALGLADRNSVAGVVRGWDGQKTTGVRMIPGARVDLTDGRALLLYPTDRPAWSRLTRLLSIGKGRGGKGLCIRKRPVFGVLCGSGELAMEWPIGVSFWTP
jgi:error-prone DNA polymerase